jgi:hypothetical protein
MLTACGSPLSRSASMRSRPGPRPAAGCPPWGAASGTPEVDNAIASNTPRIRGRLRSHRRRRPQTALRELPDIPSNKPDLLIPKGSGGARRRSATNPSTGKRPCLWRVDRRCVRRVVFAADPPAPSAASPVRSNARKCDSTARTVRATPGLRTRRSARLGRRHPQSVALSYTRHHGATPAEARPNAKPGLCGAPGRSLLLANSAYVAKRSRADRGFAT